MLGTSTMSTFQGWMALLQIITKLVKLKKIEKGGKLYF